MQPTPNSYSLAVPVQTSDLAAKIRDVPDFPKAGILFKDITTLLKDGNAFRSAIDGLLERIGDRKVDAVVGMESRGFIFAAPIAYKLGVGFVPVRKLGKLPADVVSVEYDLEYGSATLEMHRDAIRPGARVLIVDDPPVASRSSRSAPARGSSSSMTCWRPAAPWPERSSW